MANQDEKRRKFWDEEDENPGTLTGSKASVTSSGAATDSMQLDRQIHETRVLMEQTHQLYLHYFNGIEKRTPIEKLKQLEAKIAELQRNTTPITTLRFKISQFLSNYSQMKSLWERKLRELERK